MKSGPSFKSVYLKSKLGKRKNRKTIYITYSYHQFNGSYSQDRYRYLLKLYKPRNVILCAALLHILDHVRISQSHLCVDIECGNIKSTEVQDPTQAQGSTSGSQVKCM